MAKGVARGLLDIVYRLAPQFSRGATAFAPVAFPGRITYTGAGLVGLDATAPVKRQFLSTPTVPDYAHGTYALLQPGWGEGNPFRTGYMHHAGLMPNRVNAGDEPQELGGDPDLYDFENQEWDGQNG